MKVSFAGIGEQAVTFEAQPGTEPGKAVKMIANGTVGPCADGNIPCGIAINVRDGVAAVAVSGYCRVKYSGSTAPSLGYTLLAADGAGGIKAVTSGGRQFLVVDVDDVSGTAGILL